MRGLAKPYFLTILFLVAALGGTARAQGTEENVYRDILDGRELVEVFGSLQKRIGPSVVLVNSGLDHECLGIVVSSRGLVLTKGSEVLHSPSCKFHNGKEYPASIVAKDEENDLLLLKTKARGLKPVKWSGNVKFKPGQWVVSAGRGRELRAVGVLSVIPRKISAASGYLGVQLGEGTEESGGVPVTQVMPDTAAEKAGLQAGDLIASLEGETTKDTEEFIAKLKSHDPGDTVKIVVMRDSKRLEMTVVLGKREEEQSSRERGRSRFQRRRPQVSKRAVGFPLAFTHDTILEPGDVGGPVLDVRGKVIGINIARASRTESLALPSHVVKAALKRMLESQSSKKTSSSK